MLTYIFKCGTIIAYRGGTLMTYREWKKTYNYYREPKEGWRLCDCDIAERYSNIRENLREEYPKHWKRYLKEVK